MLFLGAQYIYSNYDGSRLCMKSHHNTNIHYNNLKSMNSICFLLFLIPINGSETCAVCEEIISGDGIVKCGTCLHAFHRDCIPDTCHKCPLCLKNLKSASQRLKVTVRFMFRTIKRLLYLNLLLTSINPLVEMTETRMNFLHLWEILQCTIPIEIAREYYKPHGAFHAIEGVAVFGVNLSLHDINTKVIKGNHNPFSWFLILFLHLALGSHMSGKNEFPFTGEQVFHFLHDWAIAYEEIIHKMTSLFEYIFE